MNKDLPVLAGSQGPLGHDSYSIDEYRPPVVICEMYWPDTTINVQITNMAQDRHGNLWAFPGFWRRMAMRIFLGITFIDRTKNP